MMRYNRDHIFWNEPHFHILYWMQWVFGAAAVIALWAATPWFPWK